MENLFKALGDHNRLRILNILRKKELCVCEIEMVLETTQSNVSRHLSKLKNESIITFKKKAQWKYYRINERFIEGNAILYRYLSETMDKTVLFQKDLEKLNNYIDSDLTSVDVCMGEKILK